MESLKQYINNLKESKSDIPNNINLYDLVDDNYKGYEIFDLITGTHKFKTISEALKAYGVKDCEFTKYTLRPYVAPYTPRELNLWSTLPESHCFDYIINGTKMSSMRFSSADCKPVMKEKTRQNMLLVYIVTDKKAIFILPRLDEEYVDEGYACILDDEKHLGGKQIETKLYQNLANLYHDRERIDWLYNVLANYKPHIGNKFVSAYERDTWDD